MILSEANRFACCGCMNAHVSVRGSCFWVRGLSVRLHVCVYGGSQSVYMSVCAWQESEYVYAPVHGRNQSVHVCVYGRSLSVYTGIFV